MDWICPHCGHKNAATEEICPRCRYWANSPGAISAPKNPASTERPLAPTESDDPPEPDRYPSRGSERRADRGRHDGFPGPWATKLSLGVLGALAAVGLGVALFAGGLSFVDAHAGTGGPQAPAPSRLATTAKTPVSPSRPTTPPRHQAAAPPSATGSAGSSPPGVTSPSGKTESIWGPLRSDQILFPCELSIGQQTRAGQCLVDTGSSLDLVNDNLMEAWGLTPTGSETVSGIGGDTTVHTWQGLQLNPLINGVVEPAVWTDAPVSGGLETAGSLVGENIIAVVGEPTLYSDTLTQTQNHWSLTYPKPVNGQSPVTPWPGPQPQWP